jgi:di/tricarboxylate transporter
MTTKPLCAVICLIVLLASALLSPESIPAFIDCPFRLLTQKLCPLCGMTHAFVAMIHGEFLAAFNHNPLGLVLFIGVVLGAVSPLLSEKILLRLKRVFDNYARLAVLAFVCFGFLRVVVQ